METVGRFIHSETLKPSHLKIYLDEYDTIYILSVHDILIDRTETMILPGAKSGIDEIYNMISTTIVVAMDGIFTEQARALLGQIFQPGRAVIVLDATSRWSIREELESKEMLHKADVKNLLSQYGSLVLIDNDLDTIATWSDAYFVEKGSFNSNFVSSISGKQPMQPISKSFMESIVRPGKKSIVEDEKCPLGMDEKMILIAVFSTWTSIKYNDHSEAEILDQMAKVKKFISEDLVKILNLDGPMAEITGAMHMDELDEFIEIDLMNYVNLFHIDVGSLNDLQDKMDEDFAKISKEESQEVLQEISERNEQQLMSNLKMLIMQFKIDCLERLRIWRWREEVLLGHAVKNFVNFPGVFSIHDAEKEHAYTILENGIEYYYLRVGEAKRELLVEKYTYFDLFHMASILGSAHPRDVVLTTGITIEDVADMILLLLEDLGADPRHLLTPLGIRIIVNKEADEVSYNFRKELDTETLALACSQMGVDAHKPTNVLIEELSTQYVLPHFYSGIEQHRNWEAAIGSKTLVSMKSVFTVEDHGLIFYGTGNGTSKYRVYTPTDLITSFESGVFLDPWSMKNNADNPLLWRTFSDQNIDRLLKHVIPAVHRRSKRLRPDLDRLISVIVANFESRENNITPSQGVYVNQVDRQKIVLGKIKMAMRDPKSRSQIGTFLSYFFNTGIYFSEWDRYMLNINNRSIEAAIINNPLWKRVHPEWTSNLNGKVFDMLTMHYEKYLDFDAGDYIRELKLVKLYNDEYKMDFNSEESSIEGYMITMRRLNGISMFESIRTFGNWMMVTADYYHEILFGVKIVDTEISISLGPQSASEHKI